MNYGFPGTNSHFENHGVTEESFWPSFTDIMMVIVMVFLLVTVAVILNNWSLIGDLKNSIQAQQVASSLAENRQEKNITLETSLQNLEASLVALNNKYELEKESLIASKEKLSNHQQQLKEKESAMKFLKTQIVSLNAELSDSKNNLVDTKEALFVLNDKYDLEKEKLLESKLSLLDARQEITAGQQALSQKQSAFIILQKDRDEVVVQRDDSNAKGEEAKKLYAVALEDRDARLEQLNTENEALEQSLQSKLSSLTETLKQNKELLMFSETQKSTLEENFNAQTLLKKALEESDLSLADLKKRQLSEGKQINSLETKLANLLADKTDLETKFKSREIAFEELQDELQNIETIKSKKIIDLEDSSNQLTKKLEATNVDKRLLEDKLEHLMLDYRANQASLAQADATSKEAKQALTALQESQETQNITLSDTETSLQKAEQEKQRIIKEMNAKLTENDEKLVALATSITDFTAQMNLKDEEILALKARQGEGETQLLSLQGEYDTLDTKYQKLLRPARSSKGKFVVTVSYKSRKGDKVIRFKGSPNASYETLSKSELHKKLSALKKKHKADLYLKVIIPKNSGLSYNEAWKFTSNLQKMYDYYHQE